MEVPSTSLPTIRVVLCAEVLAYSGPMIQTFRWKVLFCGKSSDDLRHDRAFHWPVLCNEALGKKPGAMPNYWLPASRLCIQSHPIVRHPLPRYPLRKFFDFRVYSVFPLPPPSIIFNSILPLSNSHYRLCFNRRVEWISIHWLWWDYLRVKPKKSVSKSSWIEI